MFLLLLAACPARAQYEGLIYGEVILKDKTVLTGPIRWSGGQVLWTDILLVSKQNSYILNYLNKEQLGKLNNAGDEGGFDWQFMDLWKDKQPQRQNELLCQFGDIASIHVTGPREAQIFLKNGSKLRVAASPDESRHLGKSISIYSGSFRRISWEQISWIKFRATPANLVPLKGRLLYGTVRTSRGDLSGFIQWDKIKFHSRQKLQGKVGNNTENSEFRFEDIQSIEKRDKGAIVKFHSDKKLFLKNNGDVNAANRGIVVMHPEWGRAIVEWSAFQSVRFTRVPDGLGYANYPKPSRIYATVRMKNGEVYKGNCTFDLDEDWTAELLEGTSHDIHYQIPFRTISGISIQDGANARIVLKDGRVLLLSNHNDVTDKNWGLIVWLKNSRYKYIAWNQVNDITFR